VVYVRPPPSLAHYIPGEIAVEVVAQDLMNRDEAMKQLKFHLQRAHDQMSKNLPTSTNKVRDEVYLKIRPHKQKSMPTRLHLKLSTRYYGPVVVIAQVGSVTYRLQFPEEAHIHPVFHISQLKRAVVNGQVGSTLPPDLQGLGEGLNPKQICRPEFMTSMGNR